MLTRREMLSRLHKAQAAGVPVTNYGLAISFTQGVIRRVLEPFPSALIAFDRQVTELNEEEGRDRSHGQTRSERSPGAAPSGSRPGGPVIAGRDGEPCIGLMRLPFAPGGSASSPGLSTPPPTAAVTGKLGALAGIIGKSALTGPEERKTEEDDELRILSMTENRSAAGEGRPPRTGSGWRRSLRRRRNSRGSPRRRRQSSSRPRTPELIDQILETAREIKQAIYGDRLVLFAPSISPTTAPTTASTAVFAGATGS